MRRLLPFVLLAAMTAALAACGGGTSESSSSATDALAGSDQQTLDKYTTADVTPIDQIDKSKLGLITEGTLRVGTLSDAPPNIFIDGSGKFTGYDNELLRAVAGRLQRATRTAVWPEATTWPGSIRVAVTTPRVSATSVA